jgi:hypothetical protein
LDLTDLGIYSDVRLDRPWDLFRRWTQSTLGLIPTLDLIDLGINSDVSGPWGLIATLELIDLGIYSDVGLDRRWD